MTTRTETEARFHDDHAAAVDLDRVDVNVAFNAYTAVENRVAMAHLGSVQGLRLLDIGCGYGEASVYFARQGADVTGVDISDAMLELAGRLASRYDVRPTFTNVPLEKLPFADASFDRIYGFGVLHHVDWHQAVREIRRVLKPGGRAAIVEPVAYNPIVNIYRRMATRYRSPDERPFRRGELEQIVAAFPHGRYVNCWLLGQLAFCYMYLVERVHPNDAPYWKKIVQEGERYRSWLAPLLRWDQTLTALPGLRWFAYSTVLCLEA
jgi:ubiquinone/menaquinone biosynthesis C-methylase UbiE